MDPDLLDQHAHIATVRIDGAKNTRRSFLASLVYPHLPHSHSLSSFESVLHATRDIGHYLVQADLFQSVHARLEASADPSAKPGDVDVIFTTRERPRFFLKTSTEVGNSEGTAVRTHIIPVTCCGLTTILLSLPPPLFFFCSFFFCFRARRVG
jgi:outer membrane protein insertion porin family